MQILIIISWSCFVCMTISGLFLGMSYSRADREKYPIIKRLDGKKLILTIVFFVTLLGFAIPQAVKDSLFESNKFEYIYLPDGEHKEKATLKAFEDELENESRKIILKAREYFKIGEAMLNDKNYSGGLLNIIKSLLV